MIKEIQVIEDIIRQFPQTEIETRHYFAGGIYEREIHVPQGTIITGKIHLTEHLAKLVHGVLRIISEDQQDVFVGPHTFVSRPGIKRLGYADTDVVFSTFHFVGDKTDLDEIEKSLVVDTLEQYLEHEGKQQERLT